MGEVREPTTIVIDNDNGAMAVEITVHMSDVPGTTHVLPTGETIKPGEEWQGHNVMFYGIEEGRIISIRGSLSGPGKIAKVK